MGSYGASIAVNGTGTGPSKGTEKPHCEDRHSPYWVTAHVLGAVARFHPPSLHVGPILTKDTARLRGFEYPLSRIDKIIEDT